MSYPLSGEVVFKVTFERHGFPIGAYTSAAIIHVCAEQVHAISPFNNHGTVSYTHLRAHETN